MKTDATGEDYRKLDFKMSQMGAAYAIVPSETDIEFITKTGNGDVYLGILKWIDAQVSKVFLGSESVNTEKSFTGASEVQERIMEEFIQADLRYITNLVNDVVLPQLNRLGFGLEGLKFKYDNVEKVSIDQKINVLKTVLGTYRVDPKVIKDLFGLEVDPIEVETP